MTGKLCFWAILSTTDLKFIYFSPSLAKLLGIPPNVVPELLQDKCLWDLIHPEEYAMARGDLKKFMETKHIGGSVTRCRLVDLDDIIEPKIVRRSSAEIDIPVKIQPRPLDRRISSTSGPNWEVVDIVMYLVTHDIILTFFHADYDVSLPNGAGSLPLICQEVDFTIQDGIELMSILRTTSLTTTGVMPSGNIRIFQIMETETSKVLVTWPPVTDKCRDSMQISDTCLSELLLDFIERNKHRHIDRMQMHPYEYATCVHQTQVHTQLIYESGPAKKAEGVVIQYGSVTFGAFDISHVDQPATSLIQPSISSDTTNLSLLSPIAFTQSSSSSPASFKSAGRSLITCIDPKIGSKDVHYLSEHSPDENEIAPPNSTEHHSKILSSTSVWNANIQSNASSTNANRSRVVCENCHTDSSPEWRKGPTGQKTLCNACGLRYARSVAKQDTFGRRQRGVRVVINNDPQYKYPKSPMSVNSIGELPHHTEYFDDLSNETKDHESVHPDPVQQSRNTIESETASSRTKRRKKSRYLPIGDNRAGARTRAARKARMIQSDATKLLTQKPSTFPL